MVVLFWMTMNVLLWRSEMGHLERGGTPVPVGAVWDRILTAPDESPLVVFRGEQRLGTVRWTPTVAEEPAPQDVGNEFAPEGRVGRITGYQIEADASLRVESDAMRRLRLQGQATFSADKEWTSLLFRLIRRPEVWEMRADAATERLVLRVGDSPSAWEESFTFEELGNPRVILGRLALPWAWGGLETVLTALPSPQPRAIALGIEWEARQDWMTIGHARTRVYRLRARLFDQHEVAIVVSRVGEILKVNLPGDIRLVSEAFAAFPGDIP